MQNIRGLEPTALTDDHGASGAGTGVGERTVQVHMCYCLLTPGTQLSPVVATVLHCCAQGLALAAFPQSCFSSARCHVHMRMGLFVAPLVFTMYLLSD